MSAIILDGSSATVQYQRWSLWKVILRVATENTQTAKVYGNNIGIFRDVDNFWDFSPSLLTSFMNHFVSTASFTDLTTVFLLRSKYVLSSGANLLQAYQTQ